MQGKICNTHIWLFNTHQAFGLVCNAYIWIMKYALTFYQKKYYMHTSHKVNVGLLGSYWHSKAQFEKMRILHLWNMFSTNNHKPKLGHFHWNPCASITNESNYLVQYLHVGHKNMCKYWEPQIILNMVVQGCYENYIMRLESSCLIHNASKVCGFWCTRKT